MRSDHSRTWYKHGNDNSLHASMIFSKSEIVRYTLVAIPIRTTKLASEKYAMNANDFLLQYFS